MKPYIIIILSLISILNGQAQQKEQKPDKAVEELINEGLQAYDKANYREAELDFRKALAKEPVNAVASYNLGLTQTELDKNLEAAHYFEKAAKQADDPLLKSKAYYNQGNVWFNKKKYDKAVEAYKNALRQNPSDEEARYNLALAQQKLKQQQKKNKQKQKKNKQNKQNKQNKNQQNKDQNKQGQNKKDQQKNKNGQDKKNQNKQNKKYQDKKGKGDKKKDKNKQNKQGKDQKDKANQDQQKQKQQSGQKGQKQQEKQGEGQKRKAQLTPQQVKQLLVALKNKEQKTQKKIKAKVLKGSGKKRKQDKDW